MGGHERRGVDGISRPLVCSRVFARCRRVGGNDDVFGNILDTRGQIDNRRCHFEPAPRPGHGDCAEPHAMGFPSATGTSRGQYYPRCRSPRLRTRDALAGPAKARPVPSYRRN